MNSRQFKSNMTNQIIQGFLNGGELFKKSLEVFWPTVNRRGFTEANMVLHFISGIRELFTNKILTTLIEVPFYGKDRLDGLVLLKSELSLELILIEAKRIKENNYDSAYQSIKRDVRRMLEIRRIADICNRIQDSNFRKVQIYPVYLSDVWIGNKSRSMEVIPYWKGEESPIFENWITECNKNMWQNGKVTYNQLLAIGPSFLVEKSKDQEWIKFEDSVNALLLR